MKIVEKAHEIAQDFTQAAFSKFVDNTGQRDVTHYIVLFGTLGVDQATVWDAYENWQYED